MKMKDKKQLSEGSIEKIKAFIGVGKTSSEMYDFLITEGIISPIKNLQNLFHELNIVDQRNAVTKVSYFVDKQLNGVVRGKLQGPHGKIYSLVVKKKEVSSEISDDEIRPVVENGNCIPELRQLKEEIGLVTKNDVLSLINDVQLFFNDPGKYNPNQLKKLVEQIEAELKPSHIIEAILDEWKQQQNNCVETLKERFGI